MKIKFETEVKNCHECPFCYHYSDFELSGHFCRLRETMGELYAFANEEEKGIHKNCPFLQKSIDKNNK